MTLRAITLIGNDPQLVLNGAKEINKCLESLFPTDEYQGHEEVLVMALIALGWCTRCSAVT